MIFSSTRTDIPMPFLSITFNLSFYSFQAKRTHNWYLKHSSYTYYACTYIWIRIYMDVSIEKLIQFDFVLLFMWEWRRRICSIYCLHFSHFSQIASGFTYEKWLIFEADSVVFKAFSRKKKTTRKKWIKRLKTHAAAVSLSRNEIEFLWLVNFLLLFCFEK